MFHKARICDLISFGTMLQVALTEHATDELAKHGLHKNLLDALIKDLQNTLDEWHGQVSTERIQELTQKIFNGASGTNRKDS